MQKMLDFADYLNRKEILTAGNLNDHLSEAYEETSSIQKSAKAREQSASRFIRDCEKKSVKVNKRGLL